MNAKRGSCGLLLFALAVSNPVMSENLTPEQRLLRAENLIASQAEQLQKLEQLRNEMTVMREMLEKQNYEMEQIKQRQRNLYQDMDRRLSDLESGSGSSSSAAPVAPPLAVSAVSAAAAGATPAPASTASDPDGKAAYDKAFELLKQGRYAQSITEFRGFIQQYPQSKYLDNAQYWLAEACYVSRDYPAALTEFQKILSNHKDSNKLQGAELKVGYTYYEMKDWANARTTLESVMTRYPNTSVAAKADERLQRMKREGH